MTLIIMLGFEKLFIILRTLIIRKTIQCTASHHTFTQQNSVNIIKSDAEHKRVRLNNEKSSVHICRQVPVLKCKTGLPDEEIQVMHHTNIGTTGTIGRNLQTTTIYHFLHTNSIAHEEKTLNSSDQIF
ncbi:hypothetical protein T11_8146 [Trichinella zimbabwensis]|uniref:Uncharacterized protein n=1 Tax=Trichinella zimbabwensis TaxID=268475 RepID=A0A0V1HYQ4_9BILA|nr:hypothetical protein T11_8146 [Trichinella zimbabwensis]